MRIIKLLSIFFVKTSPKTVFIKYTKALEDIDDPLKMKRLRYGCVMQIHHILIVNMILFILIKKNLKP
jgi:hypothetical protein